MKTKWIVAALAAMMALPFAGCDNGSSEPEEPGVVYKDGWLLAGSTVRQYRGAETSVTTPEGVTRIGEHAFENCTGITEVTIRDGVTVIDDYAFYGCKNLAAVSVPASVALIGDYAFSGCALETVRYGGTVGQWCAVDGVGSLARAEHVSVDGIEDLNGTAAIEIPDGTKTIAAGAFYYCESLTDVTYGGTQAQWDKIDKSGEIFPSRISTITGKDDVKINVGD
ncbi:MAG: leucine-rich repeat domain-containing protein [Treponema sp.]|nr:leucine-rich repeat domain-containing protein [Treponema sp.]